MTIRTLLVGDATGRLSDAADDSCWIWHESVEAGTLSPLIHHLALSVRSARSFAGARILAPIPDARKRGRTIRVDFASDQAHVVEADVAEEAVIVQPTGEHAHAVLAPLVVGAAVVVLAAEHADAVVADHSL